jgi:hypothetical protein
VCTALLEPQGLLDALDTDATSQRNKQLEQQMAYLERQMMDKRDDNEKLGRAYLAGAFDAHKLAARRKLAKGESARMSEEPQN